VRHLNRPQRPWLRDRRVLITAGLILVLVPTLFTVFPEWSEWCEWVRVVILGGWIFIALLVVEGSATQSEQLEDLMGVPLERRREQRILAGERLLTSLLTNGTELPDHYEFRVFGYDDQADRLIPIWEPEGVEGSEGWEPGKGATGVAWDLNEYVQVRGGAVSDGTYGLTKAQQHRYSNLEVVAAMPIRNARAEKIGVLTGSSTRDDGRLASPMGQQRHRELCEIVARILIDVLEQARD
jgi:hypothetical protein